jgi:eukaryotic-like serine/threonine-protein kinase
LAILAGRLAFNVRTASALAPPKQLGKYEVGAKIGGGGMATVYIGRASRADGTEEHVALKVIRDELANDEQFKSMFIDEAKILAQLSHPNVIHTLEYGVTGHHRFIAMELLSGRTYFDIWEVLASQGDRMPVWLAAWVCARIAEGLHSAHELADEAGQSLHVIHRDVNPGNIFLTHRGEVKLIDFGLAKARVRLSKSEDGIVKGKIPYLAPEQAHGRPIDRRIDVYALGATLWESVTMKRLFKRDTDVDTLRAIRDAKVPDVRTLVPDFPPDLWYIIEKSLRVDRDARYETADEFRKELDDFIGDRAPEMKDELASLLTRLFPGQEALQAKWERAATSVRVPQFTMPPPAPVPVASTSMLEVADDESEPEQPVAEAKADAPATPPEPTTDAAPAPVKQESTTPPAKAKSKSKSKGKSKSKSKSKSRSSRPPPPESARARTSVTPPAPTPRRSAPAPRVAVAAPPPKRMWISVLIAVGVVLALALALASR